MGMDDLERMSCCAIGAGACAAVSAANSLTPSFWLFGFEY
jgi:hypothetical protein